MQRLQLVGICIIALICTTFIGNVVAVCQAVSSNNAANAVQVLNTSTVDFTAACYGTPDEVTITLQDCTSPTNLCTVIVRINELDIATGTNIINVANFRQFKNENIGKDTPNQEKSISTADGGALCLENGRKYRLTFTEATGTVKIGINGGVVIAKIPTADKVECNAPKTITTTTLITPNSANFNLGCGINLEMVAKVVHTETKLPVATGTVQFFDTDNNAVLCANVLTAKVGFAEAKCSYFFSAVKTYNYEVRYISNAGTKYYSSTAKSKKVVTNIRTTATTLTIERFPNNNFCNTPIVVNVNVVDQSATNKAAPTVQTINIISDQGAAALCSVTLAPSTSVGGVSTGKCQFNPAFNVNYNNMRTSYPASTCFVASNSPAGLNVNLKSRTTTASLLLSATTAFCQEANAIEATLTIADSTAFPLVPPTTNIDLKNGATTLCTIAAGTFAAGSSTIIGKCNINADALPGNKQVKASYSVADQCFDDSTSNQIQITYTQRPATMSVAIGDVAVNQQTSLVASVVDKSTASNIITPPGTIKFDFDTVAYTDCIGVAFPANNKCTKTYTQATNLNDITVSTTFVPTTQCFSAASTSNTYSVASSLLVFDQTKFVADPAGATLINTAFDIKWDFTTSFGVAPTPPVIKVTIINAATITDVPGCKDIAITAKQCTATGFATPGTYNFFISTNIQNSNFQVPGTVQLVKVISNTALAQGSGGPYTVTEGKVLILNPSAPSGGVPPYNTEWNFGNGFSQQFTFTANDGPATVQATLRVTDSAGTVKSSATTITISNAPPVIVSLGGPYISPPHQKSITITAEATDYSADQPSLTYKWDFNGNQVYGELSTIHGSEVGGPSIQFNFKTTFDIQEFGIGLIVEDKDGGKTAQASVTTISVPAGICHSSCATCSSFTESDCTSCPTGQRIANSQTTGKCEPIPVVCPSNCKHCDAASQCVVCKEKFYLKQSNNGPSCEMCHSKCATCNGPQMDNCLSCTSPVEIILSGECKPCHSSCATCNGIGLDECVTCANSLQLFGSSCGKCDANCVTCTGAPTTCTSCPAKSYLSSANKCEPCSQFQSCTDCVCSECSQNGCTTCDANSLLVLGKCERPLALDFTATVVISFNNKKRAVDAIVNAAALQQEIATILNIPTADITVSSCTSTSCTVVLKAISQAKANELAALLMAKIANKTDVAAFKVLSGATGANLVVANPASPTQATILTPVAKQPTTQTVVQGPPAPTALSCNFRCDDGSCTTSPTECSCRARGGLCARSIQVLFVSPVTVSTAAPIYSTSHLEGAMIFSSLAIKNVKVTLTRLNGGHYSQTVTMVGAINNSQLTRLTVPVTVLLREERRISSTSKYCLGRKIDGQVPEGYECVSRVRKCNPNTLGIANVEEEETFICGQTVDFGDFTVIRRVDAVTYQVPTAAGNSLHISFFVSMLTFVVLLFL